jgi:hypothetical protein
MNRLYLFIAAAILFIGLSSCENEDPIDESEKEKDENVVQPADLVGDWDFVSLEFEGETYYGCDPHLNQDYALVTLKLLDVTETTLKLFSSCHDGEGNWEQEYDYYIEDGILNVHVAYLQNDISKFKILNYNDFDGDILKLKFIWVYSGIVPIGGIYTLKKRT